MVRKRVSLGTLNSRSEHSWTASFPTSRVHNLKSIARSDNSLQKCYRQRRPPRLLHPVGPELPASHVVSDKTSSAGFSWLIRTQPVGSRKVRCSGEYPVCSKCTASNRGCVYSLQKRAGRPKRPCVIARAPASPARRDDRGPSPAHSNTARITTGTEERLSHHEPNTDIPPFLADFESFAP